MIGATVLSVVLMVTTTLPAPGYALDPATGVPTGELLPGTLRLLTPFMNITGGVRAHPRRALLGLRVHAQAARPAYSLDPGQPGDQFLFNLLIAPVAIVVNFVASLPGAVRALVDGRLHSRVPATILIALGALHRRPAPTRLNRFGSTELSRSASSSAWCSCSPGFLVSIEAFREFRIPFTHIRSARRPT